jgi:Luciferase-like monooxygenase
MEVGAFYLPSVGRKDEIERGMAGKRTDLYQRMLAELTEQIVYMDGQGYYGCGTTEHHFHIEGEEVSTNPVMLNVYFGSRTKNMKFGQLGNVLPSLNPVNLAENIAICSQMLQGRVFAGFARGYQMDDGEAEATNRDDVQAEGPVFCIEKQHHELLPVEAREERAEDPCGVLRPPHRRDFRVDSARLSHERDTIQRHGHNVLLSPDAERAGHPSHSGQDFSPLGCSLSDSSGAGPDLPEISIDKS